MNISKTMFSAAIAAGVSVGLLADDAYLEATGSQAINTGYHVNPSTHIIADYAFVDASTRQQRVFGAASDDASAALSCAHYINSATQYAWAFRDGSGNWDSLSVAVTTARRTLDLDSYRGTVRLLTGGAVTKSQAMSTARTNTGARPLAIFANCKNAAGTSFELYGKLKLYAFIIYDGLALVRYYKPYKSSDGTVTGLKDLITGDILVNAAGATAFSSGGDIGDMPSWDLDDGQVYNGTGVAADWNGLAWTTPIGEPIAAPSTLTNANVIVSNATLNVVASDNVGLMSLSLGVGAKLNVAADAVVSLKMLNVDGVAQPRGIYTGTGSVGTQVAWLEGDGIVRVAGSESAAIPSIVPTPAGDGWYEFGLASGYDYGYYDAKKNHPPEHSGHHYIVGEHPVWTDYAFPAGAKLRLVGGILLETIPAGWFSQFDMSGTKIVFLNGTRTFEDGSKITIPSGCTFRCLPKTWVPDDSVANRWWCTVAGSSPLTYPDDIENNGRITVHGDGTQVPQQIFSGHITGNGAINISSFSKHARFTGGYAATNSLPGYSNGCSLWFDTTTITGGISSATLHNCAVTGGNGRFGTNTAYCAHAILFGKNNSDATADHELWIETLTGNSGDTTDIPSGKRWRRGGHAIVWGSNTVHVGELINGLHVVARRQDQHCNNGWMGNSTAKGIGNIVIDKFTSGILYPSTNINVLVGQVVSSSIKFDYTYQSGALNGMTLDITNGCPSGAEVKATDIGMLPARLSGFAGSVTLTDTTTKSYTMPIDFTHGTNYLYNKVGCIGSGNLAAAPSAGSIDVTFPTTGDKPVKGEYSLARFTSGGELLSGWTVTLNGAPASTTVAVVRGMAIEVKKDATGLWLDVRQPGITLTLR